MKLTFLQSSTVIIEDEGVKILCDPWLVDGEYYGSWALYPPYEFNPDDFNDIDFIYVSHIHPDHFSIKTLSKLKKDIPIIIHNFPTKFLKKNLERLGFTVMELEHDKRVHLKNNLHINILAADNCDPQLCGKFMGCGLLENKIGATWIDTMCVIDNGEEIIVNTNDCPFELAETSALRIKKNYGEITMLLNGYSGASPYPHCFKMTDEDKRKAGERKKKVNLSRGENYVKLFKPKYFMPFAGRYTLAGKLSNLNPYRGEPELEEGFEYLTSCTDQSKHKGIILNPNCYFDITSGKVSKPYEKINKKDKQEYIENVLSKMKFDYEKENEPGLDELKNLIPKCYERFEFNRNRIGFSSDTTILLQLSNNDLLEVSCKGDGYKFRSIQEKNNFERYVMFSLDNRLLKRILEGPNKSHWNNAETGSHIFYERVPEIFERGLYYCWNFFHS